MYELIYTQYDDKSINIIIYMVAMVTQVKLGTGTWCDLVYTSMPSLASYKLYTHRHITTCIDGYM